MQKPLGGSLWSALRPWCLWVSFRLDHSREIHENPRGGGWEVGGSTGEEVRILEHWFGIPAGSKSELHYFDVFFKFSRQWFKRILWSRLVLTSVPIASGLWGVRWFLLFFALSKSEAYSKPNKAVLLQGSVVDAHNKPMPNTQIWGVGKDYYGRSPDQSNSDGRFEALMVQFDSKVDIQVQHLGGMCVFYPSLVFLCVLVFEDGKALQFWEWFDLLLAQNCKTWSQDV